MDLECYEYEGTRTYKEYSFYSEGPKGRILKVARFVLMHKYPTSAYNLVFGDWDEEKKDIDDEIVTNNGDI